MTDSTIRDATQSATGAPTRLSTDEAMFTLQQHIEHTILEQESYEETDDELSDDEEPAVPSDREAMRRLLHKIEEIFDGVRATKQRRSYLSPHELAYRTLARAHPRPIMPSCAFIMFQNEMELTIRAELREGESWVLKSGEMWSNYTEEQKRPYYDRHEAAKVQYRIALAAWEHRTRLCTPVIETSMRVV